MRAHRNIRRILVGVGGCLAILVAATVMVLAATSGPYFIYLPSVARPVPPAMLPLENPIIFVRQAKVNFTFNTIADIFGNYYSYGNYYADLEGCDSPDDYFGMPTGGNLFRLDPDGMVTNLTRQPNAAVRDPEISYDGQRVLFSMKTGPCATWQIYEMDVSGNGLRRISPDPAFNDLDPAYLPDGRIVFTSDRLRWADGYENLPSAQLFTMAADGSDVQLLSNHPHGIFNPLISAGGLIYFTQWDFHDCRTHIEQDNCDLDVNRFLLWMIHSDGSREGHPSFGTHTFDDFSGGCTGIREIPGQLGTFLATLSDEFYTFGAGSIVRLTVDPNLDFDHDRPEFVTPNVFQDENPNSPRFRDPFPLANGRILAVHVPGRTFCQDECGNPPPDFHLVVMEADGSDLTAVYADDALWNLQPVEVVPRPLPPSAPGRGRPQFNYGILNSLDVSNRGINCDAVHNGDCQPAIPPDSARTVQIFTLRRDPNYYEEFSSYSDPTDELLGEVPVLGDGSFAAAVPANIPLIWQVLDVRGQMLVQERFITEVARGELRQCNGCHAPHDSTLGRTSNQALANPTNLTGEDIDLDDNGVVDLVELILDGSGE